MTYWPKQTPVSRQQASAGYMSCWAPFHSLLLHEALHVASKARPYQCFPSKTLSSPQN